MDEMPKMDAPALGTGSKSWNGMQSIVVSADKLTHRLFAFKHLAPELSATHLEAYRGRFPDGVPLFSRFAIRSRDHLLTVEDCVVDGPQSVSVPAACPIGVSGEGLMHFQAVVTCIHR